MKITSMPKVFLNRVDVKNLIDLSLNQLGILLPCLTPKESTQAIKELIKELEALQSKLGENHKNGNQIQRRKFGNCKSGLIRKVKVGPFSHINSVKYENGK